MRRQARAIVAISAMLLTLALGVTLAGAVAPVVTIDPGVTSVSYTTAHVSGTVDPQDQETHWSFEYSADPETQGWSGFAFQGSIPAGAGPQNVSANLTGLKGGTEYEVRLVAESFVDPAQTISAEPNPTFTTDPVGPASVSIDPVTTFTATTAHFSGTINPNAPEAGPTSPEVEAGFKVNWHFECTPECPGLQGGQIDADSADHEVEADATGLEPNTSYEVSLIASNAGGQASAGPESFETEGVAPQVQTLYAGMIGTDKATLAAVVNPKNSPATYQFEWGTDEGYGNVAPASLQALGAEDNAFHAVAAPIEGLDAGTTYHFRITATNSDTAEVSAGVDHSFTTVESSEESSSSTSLPDSRVWERVSPADKGGGEVLFGSVVSFRFLGSLSQAAASGNAVAYPTDGHIGAAGGPAVVQYLARRGPNGWSSEGINPPLMPGPGADNVNYFQWLSDDLSLGTVVTRATLNPGDPDARNLYLRNNNDGTYQTIATGIASDWATEPYPDTWAATQDGSHVVFSANERDLLEWTGGVTRNAGVLPDGSNAVQANFGAGARVTQSGGENALSADGSRLFFSVSSGSPGQGLYARDNGLETTLVSSSEHTGDDPSTPVPAEFELAAKDGSVAFFTPTGANQLTDEVRDGLYRWDSSAPVGERLTDITTDTDTATPQSGAVYGTVGASDDASIVYFVGDGKLTDDALIGEPNLYQWREDEGISLVATLAGRDGAVWNTSLSGGYGFPDLIAPYRDARITPNGQFFAFASYGSLTAYDTNGTKQIYLYDSASKELRCASCGSVSSISKANSWFVSASTEDRHGDGSFRLKKNLTPDGRRLFFDSRDALVPADTNGVTDVYEWHDGRLDLISSGTSGAPSRLLDVSGSGDDIFFITSQQLVTSDRDSERDLYDARVGGLEEPNPAVPCVADECQGTPPAPPSFATPASSSFSGVGSSRAPALRCAKPKVRRNGKCKRKPPGRHKSKRAGSNRRAK